MFSRSLLAATVFGFAALSVSSAFAAPTATPVVTSFSVSPTDTNYTSTGTLAYFNPATYATSGYTVKLDSVAVVLAASVSAAGSVKNTGSGSATLQFTDTGSITLGTPDASAANTILTNYFSTAPGALAITLPTQTFSNVAAGASVTLPTDANSGSASKTFTDPTSLAAFTGTGSFSSTFIAQALAGSSSTNGNSQANVVTSASGGVQVTYTYELDAIAVPEPTTIVLLGAGLVGLGLVRRRKVG